MDKNNHECETSSPCTWDNSVENLDGRIEKNTANLNISADKTRVVIIGGHIEQTKSMAKRLMEMRDDLIVEVMEDPDGSKEQELRAARKVVLGFAGQMCVNSFVADNFEMFETVRRDKEIMASQRYQKPSRLRDAHKHKRMAKARRRSR